MTKPKNRIRPIESFGPKLVILMQRAALQSYTWEADQKLEPAKYAQILTLRRRVNELRFSARNLEHPLWRDFYRVEMRFQLFTKTKKVRLSLGPKDESISGVLDEALGDTPAEPVARPSLNTDEPLTTPLPLPQPTATSVEALLNDFDLE